MKVTVKYFALYRELAGTAAEEVELPANMTVTELWHELASRHPRLASARSWMGAAVNKDYVSKEEILQDGDEVVFMPPVSGGGGLFEITEDELDAEPMIESAIDDATGAVVCFVGTVRSFSDGKPVAALQYEAYAEMAEPKLAEIGREIHEKWDVRHVSIRHRIGRLEVGVPSVVITVSSSHRKEAFEACRYAIERIKEIVPIWKKEIGPTGETWV